jgi:hypothetical protein
MRNDAAVWFAQLTVRKRGSSFPQVVNLGNGSSLALIE